MASGIWSGHSTSPARPVDQQARDTLHALSSISTHSRLPFGNGALRVPPSLPFSWFHVKHAPHCVGIASAQSGLRCTVSSVILMLRCGGGCIHNPSEGVKPPAAWLRTEHRRSAHAIRCTTDFCSSRRNARGTLASYSSLRDERYLPRGRPEHPVPAHQDEPCEH